MKKVLCAIMIGLSMVFSLLADDPQPMPKATGEVLQKNQHALIKATVVQIIENENRNGVVANYETLLVGAKLVPSTVSVKSGNKWTQEKRMDIKFQSQKKNESDEDVFIVGLNHDTLTNDGSIFHDTVSFFMENKPCLLVWPIGIEKMKRGNQEIRLKKFTVDPKVAAAYYAKNAQKK